MVRHRPRFRQVALLVAGSAALLFSCEAKQAGDTSAQDEAMMTMYSEDLSVVESKNGRKSYCFTTPMMEEYALAREPYREFRKGVKIITFNDDSVSSVDATLTAQYAIYYNNRELWEARGNVVAETAGGRTLYTQQLFWNAKTKRIYSNVDSKIVQSDGVFYGEGLESDDALRDWRFRRMTGRMEVEMKPAADTTASERPAAAGVGPVDRSASVPKVSSSAEPAASHSVASPSDAGTLSAAAAPTRGDTSGSSGTNVTSDRPTGSSRSADSPSQAEQDRASGENPDSGLNLPDDNRAVP